nr:patatin-like protein 1 [Tanacetum cinerariifolium]
MTSVMEYLISDTQSAFLAGRHILDGPFILDEVSKDPTINARMYDICIGTTAAPVYLPGHEFINDGRDFNLIDGGVAANNP